MSVVVGNSTYLLCSMNLKISVYLALTNYYSYLQYHRKDYEIVFSEEVAH